MKRDLVVPAAALAAWSGLIEAMLDAVWIVDAITLRIVGANHAAGELMATTPAELLGKSVLKLAATPEDLCFWGEVAQGLADRIESDTVVVAANGTTRAVKRRVGRVHADDGATLLVVVLRATLESMHEDIADALTGLPTRRRLADRIELALAQAKRDGMPFALLFLKLDRFDHINETLGRGFGDRVLLDVAERIIGCVREVDTVARVGDDEFVVFANQADARGAEAAAGRVMEALKQPFTHGDRSFTVTASIGIALHPADGASADELLRRSQAAMREASVGGARTGPIR